ncbi:MAG: cation-translocating P-type ATPase, partial [Methanospirillum sp.]|uniref:heavy metal translocating P-type ATPase n=1 Tax=Methanospirillum sp. TaxID=45200 RepID=UPI002369A467
AVLSEFGDIIPREVGITAAVIALVLTAIPILKEAITGLFQGRRNVCELAALALIGAVVIGEFIAAVEIALILSIGELVEEYVYARSKADIDGIITRHPRFARLVRDGETREVPVEEIKTGDQVVIRPGDIVPVDGIIVEGNSGLDESCLTGESLPITRRPGDQVSSGSTNLDGVLIITALRAAQDSTYARVVNLVREAGERRPPSHPFIDRFARWYTPIMLMIAGVVLIWTGSPIRAITILIVACPCALLLATPSAVLAAIGNAAKRGILIKRGEYLEICRSVTTVVFDKTGTLTTGVMQVLGVDPADGYSSDEILTFASHAESSSSHPIAQAIVRAATDRGSMVQSHGSAREWPGEGIEDKYDESIVHIGTRSFLERNGVSIPDISQFNNNSDSEIAVWVAHDHTYAGMIRLSDQVRPETKEVLSSLRKMGLDQVIVLTGDNPRTAASIARECGLPEERVHAGLRPTDKEDFLGKIQHTGETVCFIGDGTNDGPALARADLGISIASRADTVALETAGVVLMRGGLSALPGFLSLGIRTRTIILQNVLLAMGLNLLLIIGAASGFLSPAGGAIGHQIATVFVLLNSLRLMKNESLHGTASYQPGMENNSS